MEIFELRSFNESQLRDLQSLMEQLTHGTELTSEGLSSVLEDPASRLFVMADGKRIVACATLCVFHSPYTRHASIEDVVVSSDCRGRHLGRRIMEYVLCEAARLSPIEVTLTSKPARAAANALYQSLGFQRRDTNCYRLDL